MKINLNDRVAFELTNYGKAIWYDFHRDLLRGTTFEIPPVPITTELWNLMAMFGPHLYCGSQQIFVNNELRLTKDSDHGLQTHL